MEEFFSSPPLSLSLSFFRSLPLSLVKLAGILVDGMYRAGAQYSARYAEYSASADAAPRPKAPPAPAVAVAAGESAVLTMSATEEEAALGESFGFEGREGRRERERERVREERRARIFSSVPRGRSRRSKGETERLENPKK